MNPQLTNSQHRPAGINKREHRQVQRITLGVKQDEITKAEADRLRAAKRRFALRKRSIASPALDYLLAMR